MIRIYKDPNCSRGLSSNGIALDLPGQTVNQLHMQDSLSDMNVPNKVPNKLVN